MLLGADLKCLAPVCIEQGVFLLPLLSMDRSVQLSSPCAVPLDHSYSHETDDDSWPRRNELEELACHPPSFGTMGGSPTVFCSLSMSNLEPFCFTTYQGKQVSEEITTHRERAGQREPCGPLWQFLGCKWSRQRKRLGLR